MHLSVVGTSDLVRGEVQVPNSKYHAHRALILASLAPGISRISGLSDARHVQYTVSLLRSLGTRIEIDGDTFISRTAGRTTPARIPFPPAAPEPRCTSWWAWPHWRTGTSLLPGRSISSADPLGLCSRHCGRWGWRLPPTDCPPIEVKARRPTGGNVHIAGTLSQWISGLLLLAPCARKTTVLVDGPLNESTYVELTVRMMRQFRPGGGGIRGPAAVSGSDPNQCPVPTDLISRRISDPPPSGWQRRRCIRRTSCCRPARTVRRGRRSSGAELLDIAAAMGLPMDYDPEADGVRVVT